MVSMASSRATPTRRLSINTEGVSFQPANDPIEVPVAIDPWRLYLAKGEVRVNGRPEVSAICPSARIMVITDQSDQDTRFTEFWQVAAQASKAYILERFGNAKPTPEQVIALIVAMLDAPSIQRIMDHLGA